MPDPALFVLFGATGDLAHRKVVPALFQLWRTNLLPHEFTVVAVGRRPYDRRGVPRAELRASLDQFSRVLPIETAVWDAFAERITYHRGDFGDQALYDGLATRLDELDADARHAGQPLLLPGHPAVGVRRDHRRPGAGGPRPRAPRRRLAADRHREAVRPRPHERDPPQPRGRQGLPRVAGLPDRPLPGQGDGPQHPRLPLRQRDLRADLAPPLRRPRPDHGGGVDRRREARRVLRGGRRVARHPPEPPHAAPRPRGDGAAGHLRRRRPARREGEGPAGDRADGAGRGRGERRPRPVRARLGGRRAGRRATARSPRSTRSRRPRRSSRRASSSTTGAGPASPSTCGPASGCRSGRPRSRSSSSRSRTPCSRSRARPRRRTCSRCGSSPTRGSSCASRPRSPASASTSAA